MLTLYAISSGEVRNESELLAEWLRLTRERSEARSKEKMLVIKGQEIELEHRHARLQAQLSDIMSSSPGKSFLGFLGPDSCP